MDADQSPVALRGGPLRDADREGAWQARDADPQRRGAGVVGDEAASRGERIVWAGTMGDAAVRVGSEVSAGGE